MKRRTKIVCTLGPSVATYDRLKDLISAGMNVARINCSHGDWETRREWIRWLKDLRKPVAPVGILVDLQGPKFRLGRLPDDGILLQQGDTVSIGNDPSAQLPVPSEVITDAMKSGDRVVLGDGFVELKLGIETIPRTFEAKVVSGGLVKSKQGVTLVGKIFDVPALTEKDVEDAREAVASGADIIALSYVRRAADLRELRRIIESAGGNQQICAKIETRQAIKEIDEIIKTADIIMVARGDMGLQMDIDEVPVAQKRLIKKCNDAGKPVITATQMLESMVTNARPTRAEATDIANAIFDGTDAVMLSGETASGQYPLEAVRVMSDIAETAEAEFDNMIHYDRIPAQNDSTSAVARAAVQLSNTLRSKAILTTSTSGLTPRMVSRFRPKCTILCAAWSDAAFYQMSVVWGVQAIRLDPPTNIDDIVHRAVNGFLNAKQLKVGDVVVITAGAPAGKVGHTNLILVETVC